MGKKPFRIKHWQKLIYLLLPLPVLHIFASQPQYALECAWPGITNHHYTLKSCGQFESDSSDPASFSVRCPFREFHGDLQTSAPPLCHQHFELPVKSPDTAGAFSKILSSWSVKNYSLHLSPSSHPSSLHPPPPPLRVLPNEALCFSMWVSYSESRQPWAPIWMLVTLSDPQRAADFTLSLSQMHADGSSMQTHINTYSQMHQHTHFKCLTYASFKKWGSITLHYHVGTHLCAFSD